MYVCACTKSSSIGLGQLLLVESWFIVSLAGFGSVSTVITHDREQSFQYYNTIV